VRIEAVTGRQKERVEIMRVQLSVLCLVFAVSTANGGLIVFTADFESGLPPEFSGGGIVEPVQGYAAIPGFSGSFLRNDIPGDPQLATTLALTGLPAHTSIDINFQLAIMDSWDGTSNPSAPNNIWGPDLLNVHVDGVSILSETFDNHSGSVFNPSYVPSGNQTADRVELGFSVFPDSAFDMGLDSTFDAIPHVANTLTIGWFASGSGWQGVTDESWAIDSVEIILNGEAIPEPSAIACWLLLGLSLASASLLKSRLAYGSTCRPVK
jgi:hypothetical protein